MKKTVLPEKIKNMIGTQEYTIDSIGESGSEVRVYDQYVLKIQPHSRETDNEAAIIRWLNYLQAGICRVFFNTRGIFSGPCRARDHSCRVRKNNPERSQDSAPEIPHRSLPQSSPV